MSKYTVKSATYDNKLFLDREAYLEDRATLTDAEIRHAEEVDRTVSILTDFANELREFIDRKVSTITDDIARDNTHSSIGFNFGKGVALLRFKDEIVDLLNDYITYSMYFQDDKVDYTEDTGLCEEPEEVDEEVEQEKYICTTCKNYGECGGISPCFSYEELELK